MSQAYPDYLKNKGGRCQWVRDWPGQVILAVNSAYWSSQTEEALETGGVSGLENYS